MSPKHLLPLTLLLAAATTAPAPTLTPLFHIPAGNYTLTVTSDVETLSTTSPSHSTRSITTYFDLQIEPPNDGSRHAHLTLRRLKSSLVTNDNIELIDSNDHKETTNHNDSIDPIVTAVIDKPLTLELTVAGDFLAIRDYDLFKKKIAHALPNTASDMIEQLTYNIYKIKPALQAIRGMPPTDLASQGATWKANYLFWTTTFGGPIDLIFTNHFHDLKSAPDNTQLALIDYTAAGQLPLSPTKAAQLHVASGTSTITVTVTGHCERNLTTNLVTADTRQTHVTIDMLDSAGKKTHHEFLETNSTTLTPGAYKQSR